MNAISSRAGRKIPVISAICFSLLPIGQNGPALFLSGNSSVVFAHSERDDRDREERVHERHYDKGFQAGRQDVRRNLSSNYRRHRGEFDKRWELDFRRGYEEGYDTRSDRNGRYRSRDRDGWDDDRGYRGGYGAPGYTGPGTMTWRGRIDDYVELTIQGNRAYSRERRGAPTYNERYNFSNPLPRSDVRVFVKKRDGRGRVQLLQQPNRSNGYTAIVTVDDDKGGADDYEIEVRWE